MSQNEPQAHQPTSNKAIASLVLGILSIIIPYIGLIIGIIAIVIAKKAFNEIDKFGYNGRGLATAGLITGIIGCALYAFIIFLFILFGSYTNII